MSKTDDLHMSWPHISNICTPWAYAKTTNQLSLLWHILQQRLPGVIPKLTLTALWEKHRKKQTRNSISDDSKGNINQNTEHWAKGISSSIPFYSRIYLPSVILSRRAVLLHRHVKQADKREKLPGCRPDRSALASGAERDKKQRMELSSEKRKKNP